MKHPDAFDHPAFDANAYVAAVSPALGLDLPPERITEVAAALALVLRIAAPALAFELPADSEPAPVFVA